MAFHIPDLDRQRPRTARTVVTFAASSVVICMGLSIAAAVVLSRTSRTQAILDARERTAIVAKGMVEPILANAVPEGSSASVLPPPVAAQFRVMAQQRLATSGISRIKLWNSNGVVLFSDEPRLIGRTYELEAEDQQVLATGVAAAGVSDLAAAENEFEPKGKPLLQIYERVALGNGQFLLLEAYYPLAAIAADATAMWKSFAPVTVGALALLALLQFPLAWRLARQLTQNRRERERLLRAALDASNEERRRIASDLHDGVVQDLAGVAFALSGSPEHAAEATTTRRAIRQLRTLLVEVYPPNLERTGLDGALGDLVARLGSAGIESDFLCEGDVELSRQERALCYRTAQEAVRNIVKHSGAQRASIELRKETGRAVLSIRDDGRGFDPTSAAPHGHLGLVNVRDIAAACDAEFCIDSAPGAGTQVVLSLAMSGSK